MLMLAGLILHTKQEKGYTKATVSSIMLSHQWSIASKMDAAPSLLK
jgi:hypothetical protein